MVVMYVCKGSGTANPKIQTQAKSQPFTLFTYIFYISNANIKGSKHVFSNGQFIKYYLPMIQYSQ